MKNTLAQTQDDTVNQFIIEMTLIKPIQDIITNLGNNVYRDCDIKWLDQKLEGFMQFAAKTFGLALLPFEGLYKQGYKYFNPYVQNKFTERFKALLAYFQSL